MSSGEVFFANRDKKSVEAALPRRRDSAEAPIKPALVLDMGEKSREQGFRLNGCR